MYQSPRIVEGVLQYDKDGVWTAYSEETLGQMYAMEHIDVGSDGKVKSCVFIDNKE